MIAKMTEKINYFSSLKHCQTLLDECKDFGLWVSDGFYGTPIDTIRQVYNGLGPDRWPNWLRRAITSLFRWFESAALVHDWGYTYAPKTYWHFTVENIKLAWNGSRSAWKFNGFSVHTFKQIAGALGLALLCQIGGWRGFKTAKPPTDWRPNKAEAK